MPAKTTTTAAAAHRLNTSPITEFDFDRWFAETCSKESIAQYCRNREEHLNDRLRRGVAKLLKRLRAPNGYPPVNAPPVTAVKVDDMSGRPRGSYICVVCGTKITVTAKMVQRKFVQWVNSNIIRHMDELHPSYWSSREIVEHGTKEVTPEQSESEEPPSIMIVDSAKDDVEMNYVEASSLELNQTIQEYIINFDCY